MKKFIYYIGFLALCLLPASCSLEEESSTEVEKDKYMNDAKEAQDVLLGVYRSTVEDAMYGYHLSIYFSMGTDISQVEGSTTENCLPMLTLLHRQKYKAHGLHSTPVSIMPMIFWNVFLSKWNRIMKRTKNWLLFILPKPEL